MSICKASMVKNSITFKGYDKKLDSKGNPVHSFYYPHSDKYNLQLELVAKQKQSGKIIRQNTFDVIKDTFNIAISDNLASNADMFYRFKLVDKNDKNSKPIYVRDDGILCDIGEVLGSKAPFNKFFPDRKIISKAGRMQLQIPDMYYPGVEYNGSTYSVNEAMRAKVLSSLRTHVGKFGGDLNGMIYKLEEKAKEGYTRIVGTPFTKDEITSHLYWTQNAYQMASSLGGLQDMKRFQQALFKNGINFVADAALVNEGLQGIHFSSLMKWGEDSPFFHWFKTFDLDSNTLSLGVIPKNPENVRMKIINSPVQTEANPTKPHQYDPNKPTYVQLYDARLVTPEQVEANTIFTKYDKNTPNHYEITSYEDAIIPYAFEVDPKEIANNIKRLRAYNDGDFADADTIKNLLTFRKFVIGERRDGGVELWDGNVDITKLNFSFGNYDYNMVNKGPIYTVEAKRAAYKQGVREVQDYAVLSGKYWTKLAADTQLEYAAGAFKNVKTFDEIYNAIKNGVSDRLPNSVNDSKIVNETVIRNVLNNDYNLFKLNNITTYTKIDSNDRKSEEKITSYEDILKKAVLNLPLESLEVNDDVASILSSGYLSKRASTNGQIGLTRFDIYKSGYPNLNKKYADSYKQTDKLLIDQVTYFINKILNEYDNSDTPNKIKDSNGNVTTFGKYAINAVVPDLVKFALIKSLDKNANITDENDGTLNFDKVDKSELNVKSLGLTAISPEEEAQKLINKFKSGIKELLNDKDIISKLSDIIYTRLDGLNETSFKIADMIMDRTESGIGLRVDAAKDISAMDSVRATIDDISKAWDDVLSFWSKYVKEGIQKENPHAYSTAEVTDINMFVGDKPVGNLNSAPEADRKMLEKVGVTSIANYSYFFAMPTNIYSKDPETGYIDGFGNINGVKAKLDCLDTPEWRDNSGLLYEGMPDSSIHSYTFSGNHDKPRILHILGLDMGLYKSNFYDKKHRDIAKDVLMLGQDIGIEDVPVEEGVPNSLSAPAIAMGKRLKDVFSAMKTLTDKEKEKIEEKKIVENDEKNYNDRILSDSDVKKIYYAIAKLAKGLYVRGGERIQFDPDSFGQKPFDVVIDDVLNVAGLDKNNDELIKIKNIALKKMLAPAFEKYRSIYKMLTLLPGDPTDFAGDKEGMTGFESKSKNISQQNRNAIRWEWLQESAENPLFKPFIKEYKDKMNSIMALRTRPELSALNNGHTVSLVNYLNAEEFHSPEKRKYSANFRYNDKSQVITIFGKPDVGAEPNPAVLLGNKKVSIPYINLAVNRSREGLAGGLTEGTRFKNANEKDKSIYEVVLVNTTVPRLVKDGEEYNDDEVFKTFDFIYKDGKRIFVQKIYKQDIVRNFAIQRYIIDEKTGYKKPANIEIGKDDDNALVLYKA